jgi:hypothetical protein
VCIDPQNPVRDGIVFGMLGHAVFSHKAAFVVYNCPSMMSLRHLIVLPEIDPKGGFAEAIGCAIASRKLNESA